MERRTETGLVMGHAYGVTSIKKVFGQKEGLDINSPPPLPQPPSPLFANFKSQEALQQSNTQ